MTSSRREHGTADPRSVIADFFREGDASGPRGLLAHRARSKDESRTSKWFIVLRATSGDAIDRMQGAVHTGKSSNIKGKMAKKGRLSGLVPFLQINKNEHKALLSTSPAAARASVYFNTKDARDMALKWLSQIRTSMVLEHHQACVDKNTMDGGSCNFTDEETLQIFERMMLEMDNPAINELDDFAPATYGLEIPERLLSQAYIKTQDISSFPGWETGRGSEPDFMDMNLHSLRYASDPRTVLLQTDEDYMNPRGLVMAYAEESVKAVVSNFEPFLIGTTGMDFASLTDRDFDMMKWCLRSTKEILQHGTSSWTGSWLKIMERADAQGLNLKLPPKFGFGDATTRDVISLLAEKTAGSGAIRTGAESFNWYFPQELDERYLVIWEGFIDPNVGFGMDESPKRGLMEWLLGCNCSRDGPTGAQTDSVTRWKYVDEAQLRSFLLTRIDDGYTFPLNPCWTVRDKGWYDVLKALRSSAASRRALNSWFPPSSGIFEMIESIHGERPEGLHLEKVMFARDDPSEAAVRAEFSLRQKVVLKRAKAKFKAAVMVMLAQARAHKIA